MMDILLPILYTTASLAAFVALLYLGYAKFFAQASFDEDKKRQAAALHNNGLALNGSGSKKAKKQQQQAQQQKKELKREKKQRLKEQQKPRDETVDGAMPGLSKLHVEFEPEPEVVVIKPSVAVTEKVTQAAAEQAPKNTAAAAGQNKSNNNKKEKKSANNKPVAGILVNRNEPVAVKAAASTQKLNHFEAHPPKDVVELKKNEKENSKPPAKKEKPTVVVKKEKTVVASVEKPAVVVAKPQQKPTEKPVEVKEAPAKQQQQQQTEEKPTQKPSPKTSNAGKAKQQKQQQAQVARENSSAAAKDVIAALSKLTGSDAIGAPLLMQLFNLAELNRTEIQMLIDYLLNKQQDMPATQHEWSDNVCQKLRRQLADKEKALEEEQKSSAGIQARLREVRADLNVERALNANFGKQLAEKMDAKEREITGLTQELQALNEKLTLERQQYQANLLRERQTGAQELAAQLQLLQTELKNKETQLTELSAEQEKTNELLLSQQQQISSLEQQRDDLESLQNTNTFELEKLHVLEQQYAELTVELNNQQNALQSCQLDLAQTQQHLDAVRGELNSIRANELPERHQQIGQLQAENAELVQQVAHAKNQAGEQQQRANADLQGNLAKLDELSEQQTRLQEELALAKEAQRLSELHTQELQQQLEEQRERANDVRTKNLKLIEALKVAEEKQQQQQLNSKSNEQELFASTQRVVNTNSNDVSKSAACPASFSNKDQVHIRELFQRLCPTAVEACASLALTASLNEWIEQVLCAQVKLSSAPQQPTAAANSVNSSHKSTQSSTSNSSQPNVPNNVNNNSRLAADGGDSVEPTDDNAQQNLRTENTQLRVRIDELTQLVSKHANSLQTLENDAREQNKYWTGIVAEKDEIIHSLQHSNGEQAI